MRFEFGREGPLYLVSPVKCHLLNGGITVFLYSNSCKSENMPANEICRNFEFRSLIGSHC